MKIVFVSSEITPFASTGGLADVAGALPKAMKARGQEVWRIMPLYRTVRDRNVPLHDTGVRFTVPMGRGHEEAVIWAHDEEDPVTFFVEHSSYFDRPQLYSEPAGEYADNFERFIFFQKAVVGLIDHLNLQPEVVHCNDWQTGLVPYYLAHGTDGAGRDRSERVLYTIHNIAYQGVYPVADFPMTNLPWSCFTVDQLEYYDQVNSMKAGITGSDMITTVSRTYAEEIQTPEFGCGLDGVLRDVSDRLFGIVNGVDYTLWNPAKDTYIAQQYSEKDLSGKRACKRALLKKMSLDVDENVPLIGMVSRLTDQKGLDLLADAMPGIMNNDVAFALLGSGEQRYHELCESWQAKWPGRFSAVLGFDIGLSHEIEAGSDMFMMPSRFEPCGLNQLYSLKYGTVPIVHATGGLMDTISEVNGKGTRGTGFKFTEFLATGLIDATERALRCYRDADTWEKIVKRGMRQNFSLFQTSKEYIALYERMLA